MKKFLYTLSFIFLLALVFIPSQNALALTPAQEKNQINLVDTQNVTSDKPSSSSDTPSQIGGFLGTLDSDCLDNGNCSICDGYGVVLNIMDYVFGVVGGITLFMFFLSGMYAMLAGAKSEYKKKAMDIAKYTAIGLALIFFSYAGVNLFLNIILGGDVNSVAKIFGQGWNTLCAK